MKVDVRAWIINWFEKNADVKKDEIESKVYDNYFEKGWLDSFKFINFIADIEEGFNIRFSSDEFQDRTFSTIDGVTKIIEGKIDEKI